MDYTIISADEYQKWARSLALNKSYSFDYLICGLIEETGELFEKINNSSEDDAVKKEMGDVQWMANVLCLFMNIPMTRVMRHSIASLPDYNPMVFKKDITYNDYVCAMDKIESREPMVEIIHKIMTYESKICGIFAKLIRDNEKVLLPYIHQVDLIKSLSVHKRIEVVNLFADLQKELSFLARRYDTNLSEVICLNVWKLTSRKERNKINGEGDER